MILLLTVAIAALLMLLGPKVANSNVNNFEECEKAGYPIMESNPRQCKTPDGKVFEEERAEETGSDENCKDLCGDGTCQEMVCMAIGCPCAENKATCPQDCK